MPNAAGAAKSDSSPLKVCAPESRLTMRLSDAGLRRHQAKLIYPHHRPPPWPNEGAAPRSLEPIVRCHNHLSPCALAAATERSSPWAHDAAITFSAPV